MMQVVIELKAKGHEVSYYKRKDGGILIRRIDGEVFSKGASGNKRARELVGSTISKAREKQLKYATRQQRKKRSPLGALESEYKRVKKLWNKAFKAKKGTPHHAGYFGKSRIQFALEQYGLEEAKRRIQEAERYATGYAYSKNVEHLADYIRMTGNSMNPPSKALIQLADDILENAYMIKEEWILPAYESLYKINDGIPPEEVARLTRAILRL